MIQSNPSSTIHYEILLEDLPYYQETVEIHLHVKQLANCFKRNPTLPGVILVENGRFFGLITRAQFFEALGRPYGVELFLQKSLVDFFQHFGFPPLVVDGRTRIEDVVKEGLNRCEHERYAPVVVKMNGEVNRLVDMVTILTAQCDLLEELYIDVQHLSTKDPLTNANNRRGFFETAQLLYRENCQSERTVSVLMIDLDNFKAVNDAFGHIAGDEVIRAIALECQKAIRQSDLFGRFGGEEFIALLPDTSLDTACIVAERMRQHIENLVVPLKEGVVSVTSSIGVCSSQSSQDTLDKLVSQADQAMYVAKNSGRNLVMVWDPILAYQVRNNITSSQGATTRNGCQIRKQHSEADRIYDETVQGWARALELRDKEAKGHAQRVTELTVALARAVGIAEGDLDDIRRGAMLHDIGKIAIPDSILFKPGSLTGDEWEVMHRHPVYAFELLSPIKYLQRALDIPLCHHERWDGKGYPRGLKGEEIPLAARIFTIVDVWDALSTDRCYRPAWEPEAVNHYIHTEAGRLFDPGIIKKFFELLDIFFSQKAETWMVSMKTLEFYSDQS